MKNLTITLDEETAAWARVHAAEQGKSISRMVSELLHERMRDSREYADAMRRFLAKPPSKLKPKAGSYPLREELHGRSHIR